MMFYCELRQNFRQLVFTQKDELEYLRVSSEVYVHLTFPKQVKDMYYNIASIA